MHLSDRIWLVDCAITVDDINRSKSKLKNLKTHKKNDSNYNDTLKSEYLNNISKMIKSQDFLSFMLRKYMEDNKIFKMCKIINENVYFTLLDNNYNFLVGNENVLLHPFQFVLKPENFAVTEDYEFLLEWYQSYLDNPRETVDDMTSQVYDDYIEDIKKKIANIEREVTKLEESLAPYDNMLNNKKPIKATWFNKRFRSQQLTLQSEREDLNNTISYKKESIDQLNSIINNEKETTKNIRNKVKKEFNNKLLKVNSIIVLVDMFKELQYRLSTNNFDFINDEISDEYYYYFEYYMYTYEIQRLENKLKIILNRQIDLDDVIEDYKEDGDPDIHVELNLEDIREYYQKFSRRSNKYIY